MSGKGGTGPDGRHGPRRGVPPAALALASAALFGATMPAAKLLLDRIDPWLLAALFYLGSGVGLAVFAALRRLIRPGEHSEAAIAGLQWLWLAAAILSGGVVGPVLLMLGLRASPASAASLLLNLESVFTAGLAWIAFRENVDRRIALGMAAIVAGALALSWQGAGALSWTGLAGPLAIAGACFAWALDNNLTRKVALADPVQIAMLKGLAAGTVTLGLALVQGAAWPGSSAFAAAGVGLFGYGVSLVLFVAALRHLGTARTGAYFSVAPFIGAALAILALGEPLTPAFVAAALLMAFGVAVHLTERHEHEHEHAPLLHAHRHVHDVHHRHPHAPGTSATEPHSHVHTHAPLRHRHPHYPDSHHRHGHR